MKKSIFRNEMIKQLKSMKIQMYKQRSLAIKKNLLNSPEFLNASVIGITISRFPEVDTRPIIEAAWKLGKKIAVPKCENKTREMDFRTINSYDNLETVYLDLQEPIIAETKSVEKDKIDLQIVPGVVYANNGYRIGFGGGYYDRYLMDFKGDAVSLAFEKQTGQMIPFEEHDIPVQKIFTENGIIFCGKGENSQ
ncbi:5-formyltetrahydrofolate cyclo-ligase [Sporosarcina sp. Marseille-Q4063]|uniref:5-formyltetrahydrofolate cyclo-ligase n=1 Tax=Sporosarcina sp. Marseille-Q4063 TaxID=2810514 RepID=UPI001BB04D85|nr:5-formyltetrahydrofolate cyclo-ligase [Sporosarcina sp. Marseille-Q4063]QUW22249.1 5-formyltetrahydrofolate cyclo-ligase [Sporosarcina sp. Marseille-Q4063]